jgi:hypothetical protein
MVRVIFFVELTLRIRLRMTLGCSGIGAARPSG